MLKGFLCYLTRDSKFGDPHQPPPPPRWSPSLFINTTPSVISLPLFSCKPQKNSGRRSDAIVFGSPVVLILIEKLSIPSKYNPDWHMC